MDHFHFDYKCLTTNTKELKEQAIDKERLGCAVGRGKTIGIVIGRDDGHHGDLELRKMKPFQSL